MSRVLTRARLLGLAGGVPAVAAIAACGLPGNGTQVLSPTGKKSGMMRVFIITNDPVDGPRYWHETVIPRFRQILPDVRIEPSFGPAAEIRQKAATEIIAGSAPDIYPVDGAGWATEAAKGAAKELTPLINRDAKAVEVIAPTFPLLRDPRGKIWAVRSTVNAVALLYNRVIFDRLGIKPPDENLEWNPRDGGSFIELARKLTRPDQELWGWWWTGQSTADTLAWLKQNNGSWLDPTMTKATLLKPESLQAFEWMHDLVHKYKISPLPQDAPPTDNQRGGQHWLFLKGKAAMFNLILGQESGWARESLQQTSVLNIEAVTLPKGPKRAVPTLGSLFAIPNGAKEPDLAWDFLKWWYNDLDSQVGVWTLWRYGLPAARQAWKDPRVQQPRDHPLKTLKPFTDAFERGWATTHEVNPVWSEYLAPFTREFTAAMRGEKSMRIALETAQPEVQSVLDRQLPESWR
jgi:multiple sugar transport system substrate-binding protein